MVDYSDYQDKVYQIIGAAMTVHRELGWGLLEPIYNEALSMELKSTGLVCSSEVPIHCFYKGVQLEKQYRVDLVVDNIIIELKSCNEIVPNHRLQLFNYLRLTQYPIGLLVNFAEFGLEGERYGYDRSTNHCYLLDKNMSIVPRDEDA